MREDTQQLKRLMNGDHSDTGLINLPQDDDDNDYIHPKFSIVDIFRILTGIIMAYCCVCRVFTGKWYALPIKLSYREPVDLSQVPQFWIDKYGKTPVPFSFEELSKYSGLKEPSRILLSIKGHVFDVTKGSKFYGKWGPYKKFTGTDCTRLFSFPKWDISVLSKQCSHDTSNITSIEQARIDSWHGFFKKKYPEIGYVEDLIST